MKKYHNFVDRNVMLYLAIRDAENIGITAEDNYLLD
jgi:hypothetical protein